MSGGWPEDFLRGSTVHKRAVWTNEDEKEEEGYACVICGNFVPDGALNAEYDTHELLHMQQMNNGLIQPPTKNFWQKLCSWNIIDEENLPKGVKWKK